MKIRPDDLANLCVSFLDTGASRMLKFELARLVQKSMRIDSDSSAAEIIEAAAACGLITVDGTNCAISTQGRRLAKHQDHVSGMISDEAKEFLLKNVYLDVDNGAACCVPFLSSFRVDVTLGTFALERAADESEEQRAWLRTLSRVGLLDVDERVARVRREYLALVNECLRHLREAELEGGTVSAAEKAKTGAIAEKCALEYERKKLMRRGYPELASLVRQISLVDTSAGYDIISCRGSGRNPEEEILIEVKGTRKGEVEFVWSRNERRVARQRRRSYWIYVFTDIDLDNETGKGPIRINDPDLGLERRGYHVEQLDVQVKRIPPTWEVVGS